MYLGMYQARGNIFRAGKKIKIERKMPLEREKMSLESREERNLVKKKERMAQV